MKQILTKREIFDSQVFPQLEDLYRTALYQSDNAIEAQDMVRESYIRAYRSWNEEQYRTNRRIPLFRILVDVLIDRYRNISDRSDVINDAGVIAGYRAETMPFNHNPGDGSCPAPFSEISNERIMQAIFVLPLDFRLVVILFLLEGFSYREIAEIIGLNLETVRSRLHHGRRLLRNELFGHVGCEGIYDTPADRVRSRNSDS